MDFEHVYLLDDADVRGALHLKLREEFDRFDLLKGKLRLTKPVVFEYSMGGVPRDLIGTESAVLFLLSDRIINVFQKEGFTGWTTYPVEIYGKRGELIQGYHGFAVTGRCGPIDNARSTRVWRDPPSPQGKRYQAWLGLYFDPSTWDGSDIFSPESSGHIFVLERVKDALEREKVKNIRFERLTEVERLML